MEACFNQSNCHQGRPPQVSVSPRNVAIIEASRSCLQQGPRKKRLQVHRGSVQADACLPGHLGMHPRSAWHAPLSPPCPAYPLKPPKHTPLGPARHLNTFAAATAAGKSQPGPMPDLHSQVARAYAGNKAWQPVRLGFLLQNQLLRNTYVQGLYSSVAERQSCKLKVLGSIPSGGSGCLPFTPARWHWQSSSDSVRSRHACRGSPTRQV